MDDFGLRQIVLLGQVTIVSEWNLRARDHSFCINIAIEVNVRRNFVEQRRRDNDLTLLNELKTVRVELIRFVKVFELIWRSSTLRKHERARG